MPYTHLSSTVFELYIGRKLQLFPTPLHNATVGVDPLDDLRDFGWLNCRMARLQYGAKYPQKVKPLSRVHARHRRQTDGLTMPLAKRNVVSIVTFG